jgi:alanine dehydrogenase
VILDIATGTPVAILNATKLTDMRTGAAGAVAAKYLASKKEIVFGLIGTGRQAEAQYRAISQELNMCEIKCWSRNSLHAEKFARAITDHDARSVPLEKACDCDVLVTTTPSRTPVVRSEWVQEGTHINAIGADAPGKQELDPLLLTRGQVFVDDISQAVHSGEVNVPISRGIFHAEDIAGTLGEVVIGMKQRRCPDQITIFDSTGLAIQDLAIAAIAMRNGRAIDLPFP